MLITFNAILGMIGGGVAHPQLSIDSALFVIEVFIWNSRYATKNSLVKKSCLVVLKLIVNIVNTPFVT